MLRIFAKMSISLLLAAAISHADDTTLSDPEQGLKTANLVFINGDYQKAFQLFDALAQRYPQDPRSSIFQFMAAKSLYKDNKCEKAMARFDRFINSFPSSRLLGEAHLFKGHCLYKDGDLMSAAQEYLAAIEIDSRGKAANLANENLTPLVSRGLTLTQLESLISDDAPQFMMPTLQFELAQRLYNSGRYRKSARVLRAYQRRYPDGKEARLVKQLLLQAREKSGGEIIIGLLAPLSGNYGQYGRSMVEGGKLALQYFNSDSLRLNLMVRDTQGDPILAAKMASALAEEEPLAVVGPLRSESAVSAAVALNDREIPMITPTASEPGLTSIGPNIFQISPSMDRIGRALADYAINELNIREFAIISPDDAGSLRISKAFSQAVYELGGEVISTTYYISGATDFKDQILPLREILIERISQQLAEGNIDSSQFFDPIKGELLPIDEWPVSLGGLFLPGYPDDLKLLVPQIGYHVIRTRFLGADGWDSEYLVREIKRYAANAVFATDFHLDTSDENWKRFANLYSAQYNHPPDKVAALSYDAMNLILEGIINGNITPDKLRQYLGNIKNYNGVSCRITFKGTGRANPGVAVYSIDGKKLTAVEE